MLSFSGNWNTCYVWRHLGSWPNSADPDRINDQIELQILKGIGLPLGTGDVVAFSRDELNQLVTLIFSTTIFGWSVGQDIYIVPDNAKSILKISHHDAIHVSFKDCDDIGGFVPKMDERGFPLPEDVPDETFKRPSGWKMTKRYHRARFALNSTSLQLISAYSCQSSDFA